MDLPACIICTDPMQLPLLQCVANGCGETYHADCITEWLKTDMRDNYNGSCAKCRQEFQPGRNRTLESLLEMQGLDCFYKQNGCTAHLPQKLMEEHIRVCAVRTIECPSGYNCSWRGKQSECDDHIANCKYCQFGQQAVDTQRAYEKSCREQETLIKAATDELARTKKNTERRIQQLAQLRQTLTVEGYTKHYMLPFKTRESSLNVRDIALKLAVTYDDVTREFSIAVHGTADNRYPVAAVAIVFLLMDPEYVTGEDSALDSFILNNASPYTVFSSKLSENAPSDVNLDFKLIIKLFY